MTGARGRLIVEAYREALSRGGGVGRLTVVSDSMRPRLLEGDVIEFARVSAGSLFPGDIVIVMNGLDSGLDVHRLIWRQPLLGEPVRLFTKGDARPRLDFAAGVDQLLGRVTQILRGELSVRPTTIADRARCICIAATHGLRRLLPRRASP